MSIFKVELKNISKRFGSMYALKDVSLSVKPQQIHALVGENGAGKTTLMRILQGAIQADTGEILLDGQAQHFHDAGDGIEHGIGMVSQHYSIIPELTCLQNLILGAEGGVILDHRAQLDRANQLAESIDLQLDWESAAKGLSPATAQKLEILKLLWRNANLMILDEPTAMLSPTDSDKLFEQMNRLVAGGATVIVVTHRLPEVMDYCSDVTILRGGKLIDSKPVASTTPGELSELIIGRSLGEIEPVSHSKNSEILLEIQALTVQNEHGEKLKNAHLRILRGQVIGLAGVDGNGQKELFDVIFGALSASTGSIKLAGEDLLNKTLAERLAAGIRLIPEDRHTQGGVEDWNLLENARLGYHRTVKLGELADFTLRIADRFRTKRDSLNSSLASLSGGNQQRFVAAKAFECGAQLILAFQPARGLDIAGIRDVYNAFRELTKTGASVLVVSFDLDELLEHCDRIIAINNGRLFEPETELAHDRSELGRLMVST